MARKSRKNAESTAIQEVKTTYNVGAYIRLSLPDKKQKGDSLGTQQSIIESFIAEHSDMELREIYIENGQSGQSFARPEFQRMIADMESDKINCCVVKDLSRLGRNAIDSGYYVEKYFPLNNIRFVAITDNYDSADGESGGIMVSLKNMINESYALDVSRKVRATFQMNIKNGYFVGGQAPYGYLKHPDDCHKLVIDEYAAGIVRQIFQMAAEGHRGKAILEWLNGNGILPPKHYMKSIGTATANELGERKHWAFTVLRDVLRNRIYCGDMVQGKRKVINGVEKRLPESEWTITANTHEAIVTREQFALVQELWAKPEKPDTPQFKTPMTENAFSQKVFCSCCGFLMCRKRTTERAYTHKCRSKQSYSFHACDGMKITEKLLKEKIFALLQGHEVVLSQATVATPIVDTHSDELVAVKAELGKAQHFLKGLYESLILGDITDCEYKEMKSGYESKITTLTEREKLLRDNAHNRKQHSKALSQARESVLKIGSVSDLTAEVIDSVIEKIHVHENNRIAVKFRFTGEVQEHE
jgi:DNA invertase Pin-like site-specific DNA recombinase